MSTSGPFGNSDSRRPFPVTLAPMVGLTHVAFRLLLREYLPAQSETYWPTEMLNSHRLPKENLAKTFETQKGEGEDNLIPQILGNEAQAIAESVRRLEDWGATGIDINMGCPVKKALRHNYGVSLMGDAEYAAKVVEMTTRVATVPVSVKLRAGLQNDLDYLHKFIQGLIEAGASRICLHPRTAAQKRRGIADWEQVRWLKSWCPVEVVGNGDVQTVEDFFKRYHGSGCDQVMIGRALTARPWLLWQIGEELGFEAPPGKAGQRAPRSPEEEAKEYGRCLLQLLENLSHYLNDSLALRRFRFFVKTGAVWLDYGEPLRAKLHRVKTVSAAYQVVEEFFKSELRMAAKTQLRA